MIIKEHEKLKTSRIVNPDIWSKRYKNGYALIENATARINQKYFFIWRSQDGKPCYTANYLIGAQRIDGEEIVITPKIDNLDFMQMFSVCLSSNPSPESFSKIYSIDIDQEPIKTDSQLVSSLTPLLIVHFLILIKKITLHGLRSDYINCNRNLKKIKGRINITKNERKNVLNKRFDRVFCNYSERSINIPENRLFKRTLLVCKRYINKLENHEKYPDISNCIRNCLSFFDVVDDKIEYQEIQNFKKNKLFKEYDSAVKLALLILKRFDYSIACNHIDNQSTPVFWIDMPLLYEHYVYGLLHKTYGEKILYQEGCYLHWKPDFLYTGEGLILDTKYMLDMDKSHLSGDIVHQLSGYSRIQTYANLLGVSKGKIIPCVVIYPGINKSSATFQFDKNIGILAQATPIDLLIDFYKISVPLPRIE